MTKNEISAAVKIAKNQEIDLSGVDDSNLIGCGLPEFGKVHTSLNAVAKLFRYQCAMFNGGWDECEMTELADIAKKKFILIG